MRFLVTLIALVVGSWTGGAVGQQASLQEAAGALGVEPETVVYAAREIVTLDPGKPLVEAVAVTGDRILATGSLAEVTAAAGGHARVERMFADHVIVPGFVAQHDHPLLAALTMTSAIIAIEDWVLPDGTVTAAHGRDEYLQRLAAAEGALADPAELLLSWGYHQSFHGPLAKADLDRISGSRPIIVWHRSAHEFYVNTAAERRFAIDRAWFDALPESARRQSDFANGHYREQGWFAVLPKTAAAVNRITNGGNLRGPEQRVSRLGALRALTLDAAYSLRLETQIGSIVPGKHANFTILAANPLTVPATEIAGIRVWGTVQEGRPLPVAR